MIKEIKFKVGKKEICPCNSGKKYNECCSKSEFYSLGENYSGEKIIFNKTKVNDIYDEIKDYALENIFSLENGDMISVSKGLNMLNEVLLKTDKGINEYEGYAPCKKGCSKCCCLYLECTTIEAENIRRYILDNKSDKEISELENKIKYNLSKVNINFMSHTLNEEERHKFILEYFKEKTPCIFLNEEGACSIYKVRPLACRKFIVFSSSENCGEIDHIVTPNLPPAYIGALAIDGISTSIARYKKLSFLNKQSRVEGVKRPLLYWFKNGFSDINRNE